MYRFRLNIIILLTIVVGYIVPAQAQIDSTRSNSDTNQLESPSDSGLKKVDKIRLSTDSVYSKEVSNGFLSDDVDYTALDSIIGSPAQGGAELYNEGYVKYQDITLKAGYISIDFNTSTLYAKGIVDSTGKIQQKPLFTEGGKTYRADEMYYNFATKKAKIKKIITKEGDGFLHGENVKKTDEKSFFVENASFTTCSHEHPHFRINTSKAKVIIGEKVVTKFAYLEILDIPTIFMVPFGFFPTTDKRKSGILIPTYGSSPFRGYFLKDGGYYWAANEFFDITLKGDIYTQGGWGLRGASSYKKRYAYNGSLSLNYDRIKFGREEFSEFTSGAFDDRRNFAIRWTHNQDAKSNPYFKFNANVNIASSSFYQLTGTNTNDILRNQLNSSVSFTKSWPGKPINLTVSARHNQNNATEALTLSLPQATFSVNRQFPFKRKKTVGKKKWFDEIGLSYTANTANEIQTTLNADIFSKKVLLDDARNGINHTIPISANYKVFKFFVFNPTINYNERWYFKRRDYRFNDTANAVTYDTVDGFFANRSFTTSANLSTKLYGMYGFKGYLKKIRHTITPTVGLSYRPDFSTDFWGYYQNVQSDSSGTTESFDRYTGQLYGVAPSGKQGSVTFSLLNTLEAKVKSKRDSTGEKKIKLLERISLNTSYNMAAEEFKWQNLRLTASSSALKGLIIMNYNANLDFYGFDPDEGTNGARVNRSAFDVNGKWLRPTNQTFTAGVSLNGDRFSKDKKTKPNKNKKKDGLEEANGNDGKGGALGVTEGDPDYYNPNTTFDFKPTWNMNVNYNLSKISSGLDANLRQSVSLNGDVQVTENWRMGFSTGYDLEAKDFTITTFDFYRSLHCWEMRCTWIPLGVAQSYSLTIRVRSDVLSDLKYERRRGYGDFDNR